MRMRLKALPAPDELPHPMEGKLTVLPDPVWPLAELGANKAVLALCHQILRSFVMHQEVTESPLKPFSITIQTDRWMSV